MSIRVALYAEGAGESGGVVRMLPPPGSELGEDHLGAGHLLLRRVIATAASCPIEAVRFVAPLKYRGRTIKGSDLLMPAVLKTVGAFPSTHRRPDLVIVMIDADGETARHRLGSTLEDSVVPSIVGVAEPEFEAWLIADHATLSRALGTTLDPPATPDALPLRAAKEFLTESLRRANIGPDNWDQVRCEVASNCSLEKLGKLRGFEALAEEIARRIRGQRS